MQTLEVHLTALFESMPGKNLLIHPNPPFFTISAISNSYYKDAGINRKEFLGKPLAHLIHEDQRSTGSAERKILESLALAYDTHESNHVFIEDEEGQHYKIEHTPVISSDGELIYILHQRRLVKKLENRAIDNDTLTKSIDDNDSIMGILMQAPFAFGILKGANFVLESANIQMLELWGKGDEIIGKPILEGLPELVGQPFPQLLQNVYRTGVEFHGYETKARLRKEGRLTDSYFNFSYAPIKNSSDEVEGILMVATEVTNLVKARQNLEESEKRYRDLIDSATVATAVYVGENMEIRLANDAMIKLWGKDKTVIGRPLMEAIPELKGQPFIHLLKDVYKTGITYNSTEDRADLVVDGKKQTFYFNFTYKALRDSGGQIYAILNMAVDVTEIISSKNKLLETEERWRIALDSAELGTWDFYPETGEVICSSRTKQFFGITDSNPNPTPEELIAAVDEHEHNRLREEIKHALTNPTQGNFRIEYEITRVNDLKRRWHRATGHVFFDENKKPYRLTGTLLDITENKRIEEALEERVLLRTVELLEANQKLERSNHELEQYAYVASHDLQEPLRKILVYSDLLKTNPALTQGLDATRIEKISASAQRMSHLIQDLLNFSRLLKSENLFTTVKLNEVVQDVVDDFELKIQETKARIKIAQLPEIEASPQQMSQLFHNLISNALKFRKDDQTPIIIISSKLMDKKTILKFKSLNSDVDYYCISVHDNGIGFNEKYLEHIFEIFKRLHTKLNYEGTGIGLALCRKIVRNHQGEIFAESEEGKGAKFSIIIPVKQLNGKSTGTNNT